MKQFLLLSTLVSICCTALGAEVGNSLVEVAESFAKGKQYKLKPTPTERADGKYDCTTFVQAVLDKAGFQVGGATGNKININVPGVTIDNRKALVEARDSKIQGVVTALVDSGQGSKVESINDLKPGDCIQMWRIDGNTVQGHAGLVKSVNAKESSVVLVGAHTSGVGPKPFTLGNGGWPAWFAVRPKK